MDDKRVQEIAEKVYKQLDIQYGVANVPVHQHTGIDTNRVAFSSLLEKALPIHWTVVGTAAATATNYGVFWTAPFKCTVMSVTEVHQTKGTNGGAVTLQLERLQGTEALDAGDALLSTAFSLKAADNTVQDGTLVGDIALRQLAKGDRLALKDAGTLTDVANVTVVVNILY